MRVAVTTTPDAADRICRALEAVGLEPVSLPCIRIEPAPAATLRSLRDAAAGADWIVVTSRRAVEIVWPDEMPRHPAVAAVGEATAAAVRAAGGRVVVVGDGGAAELVERLADRDDIEGASVVFPHARAADPATAQWLSGRAAVVVAEPAYDTIPIAPHDDTVDAVIFGSPSAVTGWRRSRSLDGLVIAAMGPTTAGHLEGLGRAPDVVPETPRLDRLVAVLAEHLNQHERHRP